MIGEHPDLYCFPELHLFVAQTVAEVIERESKNGHYSGPQGLLRAIAELREGRQTTSGIIRAGLWLNARRDWTVKQLFDELLAAVEPAIGIEKSPVTSMRVAFLNNVRHCYPKAKYLHLTRHPVSTRLSMQEFFSERKTLRRLTERTRSLEMDHMLIWYHMHRNILEFSSNLPDGQVFRIKGEDLLSSPDLYLPQIADWLGVRTDREAIEQMKHPENSPYARIGPMHARGGNDGKFMSSPNLRQTQVPEPSLDAFFEAEPTQWISAQGEALLGDLGLEFVNQPFIKNEMRGLSQRLGYH
ncbi:hypothetical protein Thiofri_04762 [Thiorhodovibrio frisius]|nr:hypothetical protein Thiofri_04762 [Thiorhodovibrio frisius]